MPKFTIIIPTYNSSSSLASTLDSIVIQDFKNVEVIIMDGVSTDSTLLVADKYIAIIPNLSIVSEKDRGIYDAMNKGIKKANGEWILFLGSDDTLHDSAVLHDVNTILNKTKAKVVYGNAKIIGDTGWAKDGEIYAGPFTFTKLLNTNICHQSIFYNRAFVLNEIGMFNLKYEINADWDFNLRCWAKQPFEYLDIIIANFIAGGVSSNATDNVFMDEFVENVCCYFKIDPFHPILNKPNFIFYNQAVAIQKRKYPLRFAGQKLKKKLIKLKSYFGIY